MSGAFAQPLLALARCSARRVGASIALVFRVSCFVCFAWICGVTAPLVAQEWETRIYSEDDGLPSSSVYDIARSSDEHIFFATRAGVASYDGATWTHYGAADGLPSPNSTALALDDEGRPWVASSFLSRPVARFDGKVWRTLPSTGRPESDPRPSRLVVIGAGETAWCVLGTEFGPWIGSADGWRLPGEARAWTGGAIHAVARDRTTVWIGADAGLFRLDDLEALPVEIDLPATIEAPIRALAVDGEGLWILAQRTVARLSPGEPPRPLVTVAEPWDSTLFPHRLASDGHGGVYFTTGSKLLQVDADGMLETFDAAQGLPAGWLTALHHDSEGLLWIGSLRGAAKVTSRTFASFHERHGLLEDEVTAIVLDPGADTDADAGLLLGHHLGLTRFQGRARELLPFPEPSPVPFGSRVMDMARAADDTVWIGGLDGLRAWREPRPGEPTSSAWSGPFRDDLLFDDIHAVLPIDDGVLVGTDRGVARFGGRSFTEERLDERSALVRRFAIAPDGTARAATRLDGVFARRDDGTWYPLGGRDLDLYTLLPDGDALWLGAVDGLFRLDAAGRTRRVEEAPRRPIYGLARDREGDLWLGTDRGVVHLFSSGAPSRSYGMADGLAGRETNRAALTFDADGTLWVGTSGGLSRYDEEEDAGRAPPSTSLVAIEAEGRRFAPDERLELDYDRSGLTVYLRTLTFVEEDRLEISPRLVPFDRHFLDPGRAAGHRVSYTHLPPGTYSFEARARRPGGPWGPVVQSAPIVVRRPVWSTPGFAVVLVLLTVLGAIFAVRHAVARGYARQLESQVDERTRDLEHTNRRLAEAAERLRQEVQEHQRTEAELRHARDEAQAASRAKSRFLATMSHEIRTPMNGVLGLAELISRAPLEKEQRARVATLRRSARALLQILDDILDYSKIEAGKIELDAHPFELRRLLEEITDLFRPLAAEKGVALRYRLPDDAPPRLRADAARLRQILVNLVGNAVKFTEEGRVEIEASLADDHLVATVRDSGIGIAAERLATLGEPFRQGDSTIRRRFGGTGLGLAITRSLVEAMGGTLHIESEVGSGSTFTVEVPVESADATGSASVDSIVDSGLIEAVSTGGRRGARSLGADFAEQHPLRLLVVEDNPVNQMIVLEMLEVLGYPADAVAENGPEAVEQIETGRFDAVLLDVQMPGMDGLEVARRVRASLDGPAPWIVAVTAHALRGDRESCLEAGMDDYLSKPISLDSLATALERCVRSTTRRAAGESADKPLNGAENPP